MADTVEDARRHARTLREIKLYGVADAMDNYAALLEAQPELLRRLRRLRAAESDNANLLRQLLRVVGDHSAPKDCYSTGPLTGTALDHSCPSCEALSMLAARKP